MSTPQMFEPLPYYPGSADPTTDIEIALTQQHRPQQRCYAQPKQHVHPDMRLAIQQFQQIQWENQQREQQRIQQAEYERQAQFERETERSNRFDNKRRRIEEQKSRENDLIEQNYRLRAQALEQENHQRQLELNQRQQQLAQMQQQLELQQQEQAVRPEARQRNVSLLNNNGTVFSEDQATQERFEASDFSETEFT